MNAKWFALRNVKLMTSHSMDNALAESYKDSSTPPGYWISGGFRGGKGGAGG